MRVFHLVNAEHGLKDIRQRRLKIATLGELNDPFDFFAADLGDPAIRTKLTRARQLVGKRLGLLCFSQRWDSPVLWSHYADKHRGVALGFEIAEESLWRVSYASRRFRLLPDPSKTSGTPDQDSVEKLMLTKYAHWRYERELRMFVPLEKGQSENGLFFHQFAAHMRLAEVIVGALSAVSRNEVTKALGSLVSEVEVIKARLAFRSFRVVRQQDHRLW
jgi:Protein of unknown function (DUF2971)